MGAKETANGLIISCFSYPYGIPAGREISQFGDNICCGDQTTILPMHLMIPVILRKVTDVILSHARPILLYAFMGLASRQEEITQMGVWPGLRSLAYAATTTLDTELPAIELQKIHLTYRLLIIS